MEVHRSCHNGNYKPLTNTLSRLGQAIFELQVLYGLATALGPSLKGPGAVVGLAVRQGVLRVHDVAVAVPLREGLMVWDLSQKRGRLVMW